MRKFTVFTMLLLCLASWLTVAGSKARAAGPGDFVGTYLVSGDLPFNKIIVSEKEGRLHYVAGEYVGFFSAVEGKSDTYLSQDRQGLVTFVRNDEGKVIKLKLEVEGSVFEAKREAMPVLADYVGTYKLSGDLPIDKIVVSEKEGKLHYVAGEYIGYFSAVEGKTDTYRSQDGGGLVTFIRNDNGKVSKLKLEVQNGTYEAPKVMTAALTDYAGKYKVEGLPFQQMVFTVQDNQLHVVAGENEGNLTPMANQADTFDAAGQATIRFKRDENNKVIKLVVEAQGQVFEGTPVGK